MKSRDEPERDCDVTRASLRTIRPISLALAEKWNCDICFSSYSIDNVFEATCTHTYCRDCLDHFVLSRVQSNLLPIVCCHETLSLEEVFPHLTTATRLALDEKTVEVNTVNKIYCHKPDCNKFIPPTAHRNSIATCTGCDCTTCVRCKTAAHEGLCPADAETPMLLSTARTAGWQTCPQCKMLVERVEGCNHMK